MDWKHVNIGPGVVAYALIPAMWEKKIRRIVV
jgi:hypothetical protein